MRGLVILTLALAASSALGQGAGRQYYYSPNPTDVCSVGPSCSVVDCDALGKNCACSLILPNGWKRPFTKEQCDTLSRTLAPYPGDEIDRRTGYERRTSNASDPASPTEADRPKEPKPSSNPGSEAAKKPPDGNTSAAALPREDRPKDGDKCGSCYCIGAAGSLGQRKTHGDCRRDCKALHAYRYKCGDGKVWDL